MDDNVSHSLHVGPRDFRVRCLDGLGDVTSRFADDGKTVQNGVNRGLIRCKRTLLETVGVLRNSFDCVDDVLDPKELISRRHQLPLREFGPGARGGAHPW